MNDKAFSDAQFLDLKSFFFGQEIKWTYSSTVARPDDDNSGGYFVYHIFGSNRPYCPSFDNILDMFKGSVDDVNAIIRVRFIMYPRTSKIVEHQPHSDFEFEHKGALIYMNNNNGFTRAGDIISPSVENTVFRHDPSKLHNSSTCTDAPFRGVLSLNYF